MADIYSDFAATKTVLGTTLPIVSIMPFSCSIITANHILQLLEYIFKVAETHH